jgi:hypothetical protein
MSDDRDVTDQVSIGNPDDENCPLQKCVCGATWTGWEGPTLGVYKDHATECPACHRRFYFRQTVRVFQVE